MRKNTNKCKNKPLLSYYEIQRGCEDDQKNDTLYHRKSCNSSGCNKMDLFVEKPILSCITCKGTNCTDKDVKGLKGEKCKNNVTINDYERCYEKKTLDCETDEYIIERGCFYDLEKVERMQCTESNGCSTCTSDDCNNKNIVKGSAGKISSISSLIAIVFIFLLF